MLCLKRVKLKLKPICLCKSSSNIQGIDCCSTSVISFHYVPFTDMYVFDFLLHYVRHPSSRSHDSSVQFDELPRKLDFDDIKIRLNSSTQVTSFESTKITDDDEESDSQF